MLGALAGDIIASPYEWVDTTDFYFNLLESTRGSYRGRPVAYHPKMTDVGVMTAAVARWLASDGSYSATELRRWILHYAEKYPDCGFSPYMRRWIGSNAHLPMNNYGNGAAVRASPIGMLHLSLPEVLDVAKTCALATHRNPDAVKGAQALVQAVWMACRGRSKEDIAFAMENDFGLNVGRSMEDMRSLLSGAVPEPVIVNGEVVGEVIPESLMVDIWGNPQGIVNGLSNVVNLHGDIITAILPGGATDKNYSLLPKGTVISFDGYVIGTVMPNGNVIDSSNNIIGRILSDGGAIGSTGKLIGEIVNGDIVIDKNDKVVGYGNFDGKISAIGGNIIGKAVSGGLATDDKGNIIGQIYKIGATVLGNNGKYRGRVSPDGKVLDAKGNVIGYIKNNGSFIDLDKKVSGYVLGEVAKNKRN